MKKIMIFGFLLLANTMSATQITNLTNYPAQVKVIYSIQCGADAEPAEAEYDFPLPSKATADISKSSLKAARSTKFCQTDIVSIKVGIAFADPNTGNATEIARKWFGPFNPNQTVTIKSMGSIPGKNILTLN